MKNVIKFFIRNEVLVNLFIILIIVFGVIAATNINSSLFPEQDPKFIVINAVFPGASPKEMEEGVTLKIEDNLEGISGIDRVTSTSSENNSNIRVELLPRADANEVLQEVKNAVDRIGSFPAGLERVVVFKEEVLNFTMKLALHGDAPLAALKELAQDVEDDLRDSEQISKITLSGFTDEEIEIAVDENILRAYGLTFTDVATAVASQNMNITGGPIRGEQREILIRADNKDYYATELFNVIIRATPDGKIVRLSDVAEIRDTWSENTNRVYYNDNRAVTITVNTTNEENILKAASFIRDYVEDFNQQRNNIELTIVEDATDTLRQRISLLQKNGLIGAALVLLMLGLFLRLRMAFWVALGIPISFFGMFIFSIAYGITINVLSLFGMILVIGILVDDGVIIGENIYQHYEKGKSRVRAAIDGTYEIMPSIFGAIVTTCTAFAFFFFIEGMSGEFFSDVSFVVIASLIVSLIEVTLFLPSHLAHSKDLKKGFKPARWKEYTSNFIFRFRSRFYKPILLFGLRYKLFYILIILAVFVVTMGGLASGLIRTAFFPDIEQNSVSVTLEMPVGTADEVTEQNILKVENAAYRLNQRYKEERADRASVIQNVEIILGPTSYQARAIIYLLPSQEREEYRSFKILTDLREETEAIPRATKLSFETRTPFGKPVSISLSSSDFQELRSAKRELRSALENMETLKDVIDNDRQDQPELNIVLKEKARLLGLTLQQVIFQVRQGFFGDEIQRLQRGKDEVKVWVRYSEKDRDDIEDLMNMRIRTPQQQSFPLKEIAYVKERKGLISIHHLDGKREITVEADVASLDVSAPEQIQRIRSEILPPILARHQGLDVTFEGQVRETRKLTSSIQDVGPVILILLFAILVITFRSASQAVALIILIPFGIIGAIWGHLIHGLPLSILSVMGFIALIGILFNDGLVFINTMNNSLREGKHFKEALVDTGLSRFRPLLLTTVTTAAGLGPLILERSLQAQFLIPMAITVAYGLLVGSFLISTLLPILLDVVNQTKRSVIYLWTGNKPSPEEVERSAKRKQYEDEE